MTTYMPLEACRYGKVYRLDSRNLALGVYDGHDGFVGIREKFGREYLFTEYHYDTGPPFGTAKPLEEVGDCPVSDLSEGFTVSSTSGKPVVGVRYAKGSKEWEEGWKEITDPEKRPSFYCKWVYAGDGRTLEESARAVSVMNEPLFDFLFSMENKLVLRDPNEIRRIR